MQTDGATRYADGRCDSVCRRVPHSFALFANEWDSTAASATGFAFVFVFVVFEFDLDFVFVSILAFVFAFGWRSGLPLR